MLPLLSLIWKVTTVYWTECSSNSSLCSFTFYTKQMASSYSFQTALRIFCAPQCTNVQYILSALFLRPRPTIQSLQSTISQLSEQMFLQKENCRVFEPKASLSCFLSLTKNREPPVPFSSSLEKLIAIESTFQRQSWGLYFGEIQVEPRKAASTLIHIPCLLQSCTIYQLMSMAALKVVPQLAPNQKGMSPLLMSSQMMVWNFCTSIQQLSLCLLQTQGAALLQYTSLMARALSELMWLPSPQYPTSFSMSALLPAMFSSFSFLHLAACTVTKMDSVVELFMIPPPLFLRRNLDGRPKSFTDQSITKFYSSVNTGDTANEKLGVWKATANISDRTLVTFVEEGQQPKYLGDCQFMTPGNMAFLVLYIRCSTDQPCSGALSGSWCLKNPGLTSGRTGPSVRAQHSQMSLTIWAVPVSRVAQSKKVCDILEILQRLAQ